MRTKKWTRPPPMAICPVIRPYGHWRRSRPLLRPHIRARLHNYAPEFEIRNLSLKKHWQVQGIPLPTDNRSRAQTVPLLYDGRVQFWSVDLTLAPLDEPPFPPPHQ